MDRATARKTTLTIAGVLAAIGAWQMYRARPTATAIFFGLAAILVLVSVIPPLAVAFHRGWMAVAGVLGYINTRILLSVVYYLLLTPIGLWRRLTGHDPLERRGKSQPSYWVKRPSGPPATDRFKRAF